MKTIIVSGPTSAGKDAVIEELLKETEKQYPEKVSRAIYFKTRERRKDEAEDGHFISEKDFQNKLSSGEIPKWLYGKVGDYEVGYTFEEFEKSDVVVINIDDKKARQLRDLVLEKGGKSLSIFLHAPEEDRKIRYMRRGEWVIAEPAEYRIEHDVTDPSPENHRDFDLVVENKEGQFTETMKEIMPKVKEFIESN